MSPRRYVEFHEQRNCQLLPQFLMFWRFLRDKIERPETIESGSTIISMNNKLDILNSIKFSTENNSIADDVQGYHDLNVSKKILNIILSNYAFDK